MDQLTKVHYLFEPHGQSRRLMRQHFRNCTSLLEMVLYVMLINQGPARKAEHVACRGELHTGIWWGNLKLRAHIKDLGVDASIILK